MADRNSFQDDKADTTRELPAPSPRVRLLSKVTTIVLLVLILACIAAIVYITTTGQGGEPFTEFYILGTEGKADNYPTEITLGSAAAVTAGIVNHEHSNTTYRIEVLIDGASSQVLPNIVLESEQRWEQNIPLNPSKTGDHQKVEFLLYKNTATKPLSLRLWVNVK